MHRPRTLPLLALFLGTGLLVYAYAALTVHRRPETQLRANVGTHRVSLEMRHWLDDGYFASYGLLVPTTDPHVVYRWSSGVYKVSGFLAEKLWIGITGRYSWQLLAMHNAAIALLISALLALLACRLATRIGVEPLHAIALAIATQMVQFTFPESLSLYWEMISQAFWLLPAIAFLLLEETPFRKPRLQALVVFAMTYVDFMLTLAFLFAYIATVLLLRAERPPLRWLLAAWLAAMALFAAQLLLAKYDPAVRLVGSRFLYRTGLDGDAMFYGTHLDIALGRDVVRAGRLGNSKYLFHWPTLFFGGVLAVLVTLFAYARARAPRITLVSLSSLLGAYVLFAAVFSQLVALHPYLFDIVLAAPLILALFAILPALAETYTHNRGAVVLVTVLCASWLSFYQLRVYALCYPL
ncbi:MAG TPA: hypothetical protein VKB93_25480 [Thermoanaerobaculia bacterium]|nr:hypothetical protein [Thermoanaerobaculia bacterium]